MIPQFVVPHGLDAPRLDILADFTCQFCQFILRSIERLFQSAQLFQPADSYNAVQTE
jgi:hypothetical protein